MLGDWRKFVYRFTSETIIGRFLRLPLRLASGSAIVRVKGGLNRGFKWTIGSGDHGNWLGSYEYKTQRLMQSVVKPGMTAFDVGANAGFYALGLSRLVANQGHVWCFEPLPANLAHLTNHLKINDVQNVTVVEAAVAEKAGFTLFQEGDTRSTGHITDRVTALQVTTVSLDSFVESIGRKIPDLVKIDVEGGEGEVLRGARTLLAERKTVFIVSLHDDFQKQSCTEILRTSGYRIFKIDQGEVLHHDRVPDEICAIPASQAANLAK